MFWLPLRGLTRALRSRFCGYSRPGMLAGSGTFPPLCFWSTKPVLKREQHRQGRSLAVVNRFLNDLAARANRHAIFHLIRPFLADPDDELILELALASASNYIVTHNRAHFRDADRFGVGVLRPGDFLKNL